MYTATRGVKREMGGGHHCLPAGDGPVTTLLEAIRSVILCILLQLFIISLVKLACNLQD